MWVKGCHDMNPMDPPKNPKRFTRGSQQPRPLPKRRRNGGGPEGGGMLYLGTLEVTKWVRRSYEFFLDWSDKNVGRG